MFFILKKKRFKSGALIDDRPVIEKQKDFKFEEIVTTPEPVNWIEKDEWRKFPIFNQDGAGCCVAASLAKILGIMHQVNEGEWINFSAGYIYQQRKNKPLPGMYAIDAWEIVRNNGCLLEDFFPWQKKDDEDLDNYKVKSYEKEIASVFKIRNYIALPIKDIDTIASVIQKTKKGVMVWFYFTVDEWNRKEPVVKYPTLKISSADKHSVTAVDWTLENGVKKLIIDDSWGIKTGINGQRKITEDFFRARNFYAAYPINFKFEEEQTEKPWCKFEKDLIYGMLRSPDVKNLQDCLKYLGLFPVNIESTGNYLEITRRAVYNFQKKYQVAPIEEIEYLQGKVVGPKTRKKLNEIFA